jgi:copper homeostasis protein
VKLGFSRILTSGGATTAAEGRDGLVQAIGAARGRISIMPGSGVSAENASELLALGVSELHASCSVPVADVGGKLQEFGFQPPTARRTDADKVRALSRAIAEHTAPN